MISGGGAWPEARCGHESNWSGYCSRLVMRDVQQTDVIVDPQLRARALYDVDAKLARAVPVLPVVQPVIRAIVRETVRGIVPGGSQLNLSQNSEDWWLARSRGGARRRAPRRPGRGWLGRAGAADGWDARARDRLSSRPA